MAEPFHLTTWLRRHPLTALLLVATLCVNAVAAVLAMQGGTLSGNLFFAMAVSQLSLLAWSAAMFDSIRIVRILLLPVGVAAFAYPLTQEIGPPSYAQVATFLSVHTLLIAVFAFSYQIIFRRENPFPKQYSLRFLLSLMTGCALLAALIPLGDYSIIVDYSEGFVLLSTVVLGIACPLIIIRGKSRVTQTAGPILAGLIWTFATDHISATVYAPVFIDVHNVLCILIYLLWGLHLWGASSGPDEKLSRTNLP